MNMRAAVLRGHSLDIPIECVGIDEPRADEVLVRIVATGICHTDIKVASVPGLSPRPIVLGHEGAGVVEKVGSRVRKLAAGDHVVLTFDSCGGCPTCMSGKPSYCYEVAAVCFGGKRLDGSTTLSDAAGAVHGNFFGQSSFATHAIANERNAIKVRKDAPLELLGPLGCGLQTGAGAILNSLRVGAGQSVAVFGTGAVGLAAIMAARIAGAAKIFAIDVVEERLGLARELGATHVIDGRTQDALQAILAVCPRGVDFSLDTSAVDVVVRQAVECVGPLGTCGLIANKGPTQTVPVNILGAMLRGRSVRGIVQGDSVPDLFIPRLVDFFMEGRFPFDRLVRFYPFAEIGAALHDAETGATIKPILRMGEA
jgi:aryl-alcohol dehydrogenase